MVVNTKFVVEWHGNLEVQVVGHVISKFRNSRAPRTSKALTGFDLPSHEPPPFARFLNKGLVQGSNSRAWRYSVSQSLEVTESSGFNSMIFELDQAS